MFDYDAYVADTEFETYRIAAVEDDQPDADGHPRWTLTVAGGMKILVQNTEGRPRPEIGETANFYGKGYGYPVRGVSIGGRVYFYRTVAEADDDHRKMVERMNAERVAARARYDAEQAARRAPVAAKNTTTGTVIAVPGTILSVGNAIVIDLGGGQRAVFRNVSETDGRAFARHLYGAVRVTVECVGEAAAEMPTEQRVVTPPPSTLTTRNYVIERCVSPGVWSVMTSGVGTRSEAIERAKFECPARDIPHDTVVRVRVDGEVPVYLVIGLWGTTVLPEAAHEWVNAWDAAGDARAPAMEHLGQFLIGMAKREKDAHNFVGEYRRPGEGWVSPCAEATEDAVKCWFVAQAPHYHDGTIVRITHASEAVAYGIVSGGACRWCDTEVAAQAIAMWEAPDAEPVRMVDLVEKACGGLAKAEVMGAVATEYLAERAAGAFGSDERRRNTVRRIVPLPRLLLALAGKR